MSQRRGNNVGVVCLFVGLMMATAPQAQAYTDPGSGALLLQTLGAAFVGLLFYFRRITAWLGNRKGPKE